MSNIIPTLSAPLSEAKQKSLYDESVNMYTVGVMFGWQSNFFKAAALWNIKEHRWFTHGGVVTWGEFVATLGLTIQHANRLASVGKMIKSYIKEVGENGELPYITQKQIGIAFGNFFKRGQSVTLEFLCSLSRDFNTFRNFIEAEGNDIREAEIKKMIDGYRGTPKPKELQSLGYDSQQTLFGMHEKMLAAGYLWDKHGHYTHPDGTRLTYTELAEFVDEETGMLIFKESSVILDRTADELSKTMLRLFDFYAALTKKHHSPAFKKLVAEKHSEVKQKAKDLYALAAAMTDNEEKN